MALLFWSEKSFRFQKQSTGQEALKTVLTMERMTESSRKHLKNGSKRLLLFFEHFLLH